MAEFKSQYEAFGFYVNGERRKFRGGRYVTEDKAEIKALEQLREVVRVDEPKKDEVKAEEPKKEAPEKAAKSRKKSSAK